MEDFATVLSATIATLPSITILRVRVRVLVLHPTLSPVAPIKSCRVVLVEEDVKNLFVTDLVEGIRREWV